MRIDKKDTKDVKRILIALITSDVICGKVADKWTTGLFHISWCNLVATWCVEHFLKYNRAPGNDIVAVFETWRSTQSPDSKAVENIESFLGVLADTPVDADKTNIEYLSDLADQYFNRIRLETTADSIKAAIERGDIEGAEELVNNHRKIELSAAAGKDILGEIGIWKQALTSKSEPLIKYPGDLGEFFDDTLERDGFISFMGPEKRGKSFWLIDLAFRSFLQGRNTVFFSIGDMSQNQVMRRVASRMTLRPISKGTLLLPRKIHGSAGDGIAEVIHKKRKFENDLDWRSLRGLLRDFKEEQRDQGNHSKFQLSIHPGDVLNVRGIRNMISSWDRDGWIPDVIVIDYADLLAAESSRTEGRDTINGTWKALRALSQELHGLVVTATQSDASSASAGILTRANFSEDKRKFAHITGMVGLNQTHEEKKEGIMRLNWLARREGEFSETKCVHVAGCLGIAHPTMCSSW